MNNAGMKGHECDRHLQGGMDKEVCPIYEGSSKDEGTD